MRTVVLVSSVLLGACSSAPPTTAATAELAELYRVRSAMPFPENAVAALADRLAGTGAASLTEPRLDALLAFPGQLAAKIRRIQGTPDRAVLASAARAAGFESVGEATATYLAARTAWNTLVELQAIERESATVETAGAQERLAALSGTYDVAALSRRALQAVYARREALQPVLDALAGADAVASAR